MQLEIAAPYKRLLAFIIDLLLLIPLITICILFTNSLLELPVKPEYTIKGFEIRMDKWAKEHFWQVVVLYSLVKVIIVSLYYIPFEASQWQGTPGKRLVKIKVTNLGGQRISFKKSAVRFLAGYFPHNY